MLSIKDLLLTVGSSQIQRAASIRMKSPLVKSRTFPWIARTRLTTRSARALTWAGNSPNVVHRHYKGLVKDAEATEFWNLTPAAEKSEIVTFPHEKAA